MLVVATEFSHGVNGQFLTGTSAGDPNVNVTVTVASPRAEAWKRYFDREGWNVGDVDATNGTVTAWRTTDQVYVPESVIELKLEK